jgi:hypothetical protein
MSVRVEGVGGLVEVLGEKRVSAVRGGVWEGGLFECGGWVGSMEGTIATLGVRCGGRVGVVVEVGEDEGRGMEESNLSISNLQKSSKISRTQASLTLRCLSSSTESLRNKVGKRSCILPRKDS